jgi:hypothetical protein
VYGPIDKPILRRRAPSPVKKHFTDLHFSGFSTKIFACVHKSDRLLEPLLNSVSFERAALNPRSGAAFAMQTQAIAKSISKATDF